jgi:hypothetical protein
MKLIPSKRDSGEYVVQLLLQWADPLKISKLGCPFTVPAGMVDFTIL